MNEQRRFKKTHPWLIFTLDLQRAPISLWMALGEAQSKCAHIAGVPLKPRIAEYIQQVYLTKGVQATTAIEGNTLTENEVSQRVQKSLFLPESREYLGVEVDNVINALQHVWASSEASEDPKISVEEILHWNVLILNGLKVDPPTVPGQIRQHSVVVANYVGAPAEDCKTLLHSLCDWLNSDWERSGLNRMSAGILKAILAHLYLAWIHPFGDGNGRTARLLEFKLLTTAGVPDVAAHVLTNHYNLTRSEYYRQLDAASQSGGDVVPFLIYAIQGFVDGLREQLKVIREQQLELAWRDYVHEVLPDSGGKPTARQRHLLLSLPIRARVPVSELTTTFPRVAADYKGLSRFTLQRDIDRLVSLGLLIQDGAAIRASLDGILAFQPTLAFD